MEGLDGLFAADPEGSDSLVDVCELRAEVQAKYRAVAEGKLRGGQCMYC